jgi:hypothetical protein
VIDAAKQSRPSCFAALTAAFSEFLQALNELPPFSGNKSYMIRTLLSAFISDVSPAAILDFCRDESCRLSLHSFCSYTHGRTPEFSSFQILPPDSWSSRWTAAGIYHDL